MSRGLTHKKKIGAGASLLIRYNQKKGAGHIGCPSQLAQGKFSTERLSKAPITGCIGQAVELGHIEGLPSQLSKRRLGIGPHHSLHWAGNGSTGGATGI